MTARFLGLVLLLLTFVMAAGTIARPTADCCEGESVAAQHDNVGQAECSPADDDGCSDDCAANCGCCHPTLALGAQPDPASLVALPKHHQLTMDRAPPNRDPEGLRQVPRTA